MSTRTLPNCRAPETVTLYEFFRRQGRGSQRRMAQALGVSKGTLSTIAAADRPDNPGPRTYASYSLARAIKAHVECHGLTINIEPYLKAERAQP